jgi:hypothetical protein
MILAPNHQQPLSGNRFLWVLLIPISLVSCAAFRKTQPAKWLENKVITTSEKKKDTVVNDTQNDFTRLDIEPVKDEVTYTSVEFKGDYYDVPAHKKNFNIAILLPFHSDAVNSVSDKRRANLMLEYYQGMLTAIADIEALNSKFTLHFFDTDNDTNKLKAILRKPEMENIDLIIGPTDEPQLKIAAYFAKKREIPLFSPITVVQKLGTNNPFFFNLNPSDQMQAKDFLRYFKANHPGEKLLIVRDGKRYDLAFGNALVQECIAQKINYQAVPFSKFLKWDDYIGNGKAVIVHTTLDKNNLTYSVNGLLGKGDRITLVGPEKWLEFSDIDYNQWSKVNISFITTNKASIAMVSSSAMLSQYRSMYKDDPSTYAYMGYDQLLFACESLDAFGKYFPLFITDKSVSYSNTDFHLVKTASCFQNRFLQVFKFEELAVLPVTNY